MLLQKCNALMGTGVHGPFNHASKHQAPFTVTAGDPCWEGSSSSHIFRVYPITPACSLCFEQHFVHISNTDSTFLNFSRGISLIKYPQET